MANKNYWKPVKTTDEIGFEVLNIGLGDKPGFFKVDVQYPTTTKTYTYIRKGTKLANNEGWSVVFDGCQVNIVVNPSIRNPGEAAFVVSKVFRLYDTVGKRRESTEELVDAKAKGVSGKIKQEMLDKNIEVIPELPRVDVGDETIKHEKYNVIKSCLETKIPVYLAGPAGSGKNFTVEQICEEMGWGFYFSNSVQQEYKLTGFIDAGGRFHETEFYKACTSEDECVFFLDEMDASVPEVLVLLNAAIANGYFEFPNGRVDLEHVHFVAAGNTVGSGADDMYTGRMVLDQATLDRFAIIEFDYDKRIELSLAKGNTALVEFVHQLRADAAQKGIRATFSYRCITMVTKLEDTGMAIIDILKIAVVKGLDKDTIRTILANAPSSNKYIHNLKELQRAA